MSGSGAAQSFPAGPDGAHSVANPSSDTAARILMFSSAREPSVAVYPDSDKIAICHHLVNVKAQIREGSAQP